MSPELEQAIRERIELGHNKEQIAEELRGAGYDDATIDQVYTAVQSGAGAPAAIPAVGLPGVGEMFGAGWKFMISRLDLVLLYALPVFVFTAGVEFLISATASSIVGTAIAVLLAFAVYMVAVLTLQLTVTHAAMQTQRGQFESVGASFNWSITHALSWFWAITLVSVVVFGGMLLLIIPGIIAGVYLSMVYYVFVDEGLRGMAALQRSRELVYGKFWGVLGRLILLTLLCILVAIPFFIVVGLVMAVTPDSAAAIVGGVFEAIFSGVFGVIMVYALVVLYDALRAQQTQPVPATGAYKVFAVLGGLFFLLAAFSVPSMINMMQSTVPFNGLSGNAELNLSVEEEQELEAFMEQFQDEFDSY